ncbi:SCO family protein [Shimia haliotis]|uniref:Protein SCO1/2 n=1 Tax=Shimia haliotis TaxID=1280847 RepID=A0A1I4EIM9_9RHOB|nr:SCO family protein [Shimia haliotis]SFL04427.1 protein SCO1/2 [Shimia haliotis]
MMRTVAAVAVFVVILALGGMWYVSQSGDKDQFAQCRTSQVAGGTSAIGGPFTLVDGDGNTVTDQDVLTEPTLIYFGYTFCPDVCPLDAGRNAEAMDLLEDQGKIVNGAFITIDPERDTPEVVKDYAGYLHDRMIGLSGSPEQVKAASQAYRTYFKKQEPEEGDEEYYLVDHSTFTYLTLPGYGFVEYFRRDITPEDMAQRVGCFVDNM